MRIRYTNTRWDVMRGQWHMTLRNRALRYLMLGLGVYIVYSNYTYSEILDRSPAYRAGYALLSLGFAFGAGLICGFAVTVLNVLLSKGRGVLGEHELAITDEGLEERTPVNRSLHTWAGIRGVRETHRFYFIFVTEHQAHLVPKRRELLEGDRLAFITELRQRIKQSA